jgi:leucyl aminopeptidase
MVLDVATAPDVPRDAEIVGIPAVAGPDGPVAVIDAERWRHLVGAEPALDRAWCDRRGFTAKVGQVAWWPVPSTAPPELVLVGMGDPGGLTGDRGLEAVRRGAAAFVRAASHAATIALLLPDASRRDAAGPGPDPGAAAQAATEGAALAAYRYDAYRTAEPSSELSRLVLVGTEAGAELAHGVRRGSRVADATAFARDLVNEPPSSLTPERFATRVMDRLAGLAGVSVEVWDEDRIADERLGGLLGVARGSTQPPRLVRAEYRPPGAPADVPHVALVGKGITFDSGGLSLKTATGMETMKTDMGGAAAVLAALDAAAHLEAPVRLTVIAPLTENMPGGSATKPGDVLTTRSGKTIEVLNTDAEGRLVLADGLTLAAEAEPDAVIDLATLTGAQVVALGKEVAALFGTDEALVEDVRRAGSRAGEPSWPLPLPEDYRSHIDSEVADMRNIGRPGQAGSIAAAMLLREFVGDIPWAHVDMAGPARSDDATRYLSKGGTGFGVRTLVALVTDDGVADRLRSARRG